MTNYQEARVKLTNTQLKKLKSALKNYTGTTLRITKKNFQIASRIISNSKPKN